MTRRADAHHLRTLQQTDGESLTTTVWHIGPDPRATGGMGSVISLLVKNSAVRPGVREYRHVSLSSWHPDARAWGARQAAAACAALFSKGKQQDWAHLHISEGGSLLREAYFLGAAARARGMRVAVTIHGADFASSLDRHPTLVRMCLRHATLIFVLGHNTAQQVAGLKGLRARIQVIANPVELPPTGSCAQPVLETAPGETVLFAGELGHRKGLDRLLAAWEGVRSAIPETQLLLCGPIGDIETWRYAGTPGVSRRGNLSRDDLLLLMARVQLLVLPSRREALPMVILEAMAAGVPVISTPVGEISRLHDAGVILWDTEDPRDLATLIVRTLLNDTEERKRRGRKWIESNATPDSVLSSLEAAYKDVESDPSFL